MYTNSGTTASYIKLFALLLVLNILLFSVADTRMRFYSNGKVYTKEYLRRVAARVETDAQKRNLGQMCHALVCRRTEPAESTMPLISLELSNTKS